MPTPWQPGVTMSNGEKVIEFIDVAADVATTYTYAEEQDYFIIRNKGIADITFTVGSYSNITLEPGKMWARELKFTSFVVSTAAGKGTQEINVRTSKYNPINSGGGGSTVKKWNGVEVVWIGNSIWFGQGLTSAEQHITQISASTGMNSTVHGYPGEAWAHTGTGTDTSIYGRRSSFSKTGKVYVLYSGGNDRNKNIALGAITDRVNTTFSGALQLMIDWIVANAPGAMIVMATSLPRNGPPGAVITSTMLNEATPPASLMDYNTRAREIAESRGCYIWDLFGIWKGSEIIAKTQDGVHPNPSGSIQMATSGVGFFNALDVPAGAVTDNTAPSVPTNLVSTGKTSTSVTLSWTASTDNVAVTSYDVYSGGSKVGTVTGTGATISGLTASTPYTFTVRAKDAQGNTSADSNGVSVTTDAAGSGPVTYFNDTFTGANGPLNGHMGESGYTIDTSSAITPANWTLASNAAKYTGTTGDRILFTTSAPGGDYTVKVNLWAAGGKPGIIFRGVDTSNYMWFRYDNTTAGSELKIWKKENAGTNTSIASAARTVNTASSHDVKIVLSGNTVSVYIAGETTAALTYTLTAGEQTLFGNATKVGFYAGGENTSQWNSILVESNA